MWTSLLPGNTSTTTPYRHTLTLRRVTDSHWEWFPKQRAKDSCFYSLLCVFSLCPSLSTICSLLPVSKTPTHPKTHTRPPKHDPRRLQLTDPGPCSTPVRPHASDAQRVNQYMDHSHQNIIHQETSQEQWLQLNQWAPMKKHQTNPHICFLGIDGVLTLYLK